MATFVSTQLTNSPNVAQGVHPGNMIAFHWEVAIPATLAAEDVIRFGKVPKGFRVLGGIFKGTDMDSGTALRIAAGDADDIDRLFTAQRFDATAGDVYATLAITGAQYLYPAETLITGRVTVSPTGGAAGTVYLSLWGRYEGAAS